MNLRHRVLLDAAACAERNEHYLPASITAWDIADSEVMRGTLAYHNETMKCHDGRTVTLYGDAYRITPKGVTFLQRSVRN